MSIEQRIMAVSMVQVNLERGILCQYVLFVAFVSQHYRDLKIQNFSAVSGLVPSLCSICNQIKTNVISCDSDVVFQEKEDCLFYATSLIKSACQSSKLGEKNPPCALLHLSEPLRY